MTFRSFGASAVQAASNAGPVRFSSAARIAPAACLRRSSAALASQAPAPSRETRAVSSFSNAEEPSGTPPSQGALQGALSTSRPNLAAISKKRSRKSVRARLVPSGPASPQWLKSPLASPSASLPPPRTRKRARSSSSPSATRASSFAFASNDLACSMDQGIISTAPSCSNVVASKRASTAASRQAASLPGFAKRALLLRKSSCPSRARLRCLALRAASRAPRRSSSRCLPKSFGQAPSSSTRLAKPRTAVARSMGSTATSASRAARHAAS
mmetsp:Transcript_77018/g.249212  ORF Transcript_77018/g.249212 Transcript_77018/m.249212 type:complete len:271 (-) Transcript_77018:120-932(-)